MRKLIKADLTRIVKKPIFLAVLICSLLFILYGVLDQKSINWNGFAFFHVVRKRLALISLVFEVVMFLGVYGDEFKAMAMTTAIGRGMKRTKITYAKFLDSIAITLGFYFIITMWSLILSVLTSSGMTAEHVRTLCILIFIWAYKVIAYTSVAAVFLYMTGNVVTGVFVLIVFDVFVPVVITFFKLIGVRVVLTFNLDRFLLSGFADNAFADFSMGLNLEGIAILIAGWAIYVGISILITNCVFAKRELDF